MGTTVWQDLDTVKSGELAGIVTVTDICSALAEVLTAQFAQLPTT